MFGDGFRFDCGPGRKGWDGFEPYMKGWFWGGSGGRHGGPFRGGRMFEQGDLKYVILRLLDEKPRHGYEVIKALEDRFGGLYSPSAGTVYPTLTLLEDLGYASVAVEEAGKKVYSITDTGRKYLQDNRSAVDDIFERIAEVGASFFGDSMMDLNRAFKEVGRATYSHATRSARNRELLAKIRDILQRAANEIDEAAKGTTSV